MKLRYFLIATIMITIFSCKKNSSDVPTIKLKSIGPSVVSRSDLFQIDIGFSGLNGSSNDTLIMQKHVLNQNQQGLSTEFSLDSFAIPNFSGTYNGDFQLTFARQVNNYYPLLPDPATAQNDTSIFSFVVVKRSQNSVSDTVHSGIIVILSQ